MKRVLTVFYLTIFLASVAGCSNTRTSRQPDKSVPSPEGHLMVMQTGLRFNLDAPPKDWFVATTEPGQKTNTAFSPLSSVTIGGIKALEIRTGPAHSIAIRKVDAMLMATPYLSWSWNLSDHGLGIHPVRLVIGFRGGSPVETAALLGGGLPLHDRALTLVWGDTALRRGTLTAPPLDHPHEAAVYTVRGGRENTRKWLNDTVDLSDLYRQAWPHDTRRGVHITFIGIAAAPKMPAVRGRVANITLSR